MKHSFLNYKEILIYLYSLKQNAVNAGCLRTVRKLNLSSYNSLVIHKEEKRFIKLVHQAFDSSMEFFVAITYSFFIT